jgi:hypothetical protein
MAQILGVSGFGKTFWWYMLDCNGKNIISIVEQGFMLVVS